MSFARPIGGVLESEISRSYNSFAGSDYKCMIGQFQFAELQGITYSVTREKAPIYTMGSADPRAYSRNKRGIAGSLIWINFDRHALIALFRKARGKFVADVDEIRPQYQESVIDGTAIFTSSITRSIGPSVGATIDQLDNLTIDEVGGLNELATPWYSDQILPFDITLQAANEYGRMTAAKIFGVEVLNEGSGISIDDAVTEMQATFVARGTSAAMSRIDLGIPSLPPACPLSNSLPSTPIRRAESPVFTHLLEKYRPARQRPPSSPRGNYPGQKKLLRNRAKAGAERCGIEQIQVSQDATAETVQWTEVPGLAYSRGPDPNAEAMNSATLLVIVLLVASSWTQQSGRNKDEDKSPRRSQLQRARKSIAAQPKNNAAKAMPLSRAECEPARLQGASH